MNCLLCNRRLNWRPSFADLLLPGALHPPVLCPTCQASFAPWPGSHCPGCGRTSHEGRLCAECRDWQDRLGWYVPVTSCYQYNQAMKDFMHRYKFLGDYRLRATFQRELTEKARALGDCFVAVPVSAETMATRGFNQVAGMVDLPLTPALVVAGKGKTRQSEKGRAARMATPQPFALTNPALVAGKRVVLIDDVMTTGRTFYHAATLLRAAGAAQLRGLVLAA